MCGLVGIMGKPSEDMLTVFENMLCADIRRGKDSVGVVVDRGNPVVDYYRSTFLPLQVFSSKWYVDTVWENREDITVYMGHNRHATAGDVNLDNAHPFLHNNILLMHNGTLNTKMKGMLEYDTDSEGICDYLSQNGIKDTWLELSGAAALCWMDTKDKSIHLVRNSQRPLVLAIAKDKSFFAWASEEWMLARTIPFHMGVDREEMEVKELPVNTHLIAKYNRKTGEVSLSQEDVPFIKTTGGTNYLQRFPGTNFGNRNAASTQDANANAKKTVTTQKTSSDTQFGLDIFKPFRPKERMTEKIFNSRYTVCASCWEEATFENCAIIDDTACICDDCLSSNAHVENLMEVVNA